MNKDNFFKITLKCQSKQNNASLLPHPKKHIKYVNGRSVQYIHSFYQHSKLYILYYIPNMWWMLTLLFLAKEKGNNCP